MKKLYVLATSMHYGDNLIKADYIVAALLKHTHHVDKFFRGFYICIVADFYSVKEAKIAKEEINERFFNRTIR